MSELVRVGVVGTGFGARVVAPAFAATDGCEVVDVVSARDATEVAALCRRDDVDLISVHSPPYLHDPHVRLALAAGHAVLCDKPFTTDEETASALVADLPVGGVHLLNFEFRFDPVRRRIADLLAAEEIGPIEHFSWTAYTNGSREPMRRYGWLFERDAGGGWIGAWGSHAVDAMRVWFGELVVETSRPVVVVRERPDRDDPEHLHAVDAEDSFTATLRVAYDEGPTITIDTGFAAVAPPSPRYVFFGRDGTLECVADRHLTIRRPGGTQEPVDIAVPPAADPHADPMAGLVVRARDAVRSGVVPPDLPTFADGLAVRRILDRLQAPLLT